MSEFDNIDIDKLLMYINDNVPLSKRLAEIEACVEYLPSDARKDFDEWVGRMSKKFK